MKMNGTIDLVGTKSPVSRITQSHTPNDQSIKVVLDDTKRFYCGNLESLTYLSVAI